MQVVAVMLRERGAKRAPEDVKRDRGRQAELFFRPGRACLCDIQPSRRLPQEHLACFAALTEAVLVKVHGDQLLVHGREVNPAGQVGDFWPQAWWCRLLTP